MKQKIKKILQEAVLGYVQEKNIAGFDISSIAVEKPKDEKFGDYTTNVAMVLAKELKQNPMEIAEKIIQELNSWIWKIEFVTPGHINFYLSEKYLQNKIVQINQEKENFGESAIGKNIKVNNEFISANPTGPLHLGNGRGGFYGDVLSRVLKKTGFSVANEYYLNDAGEQVLKLGHSVLKDGEAVYGGEYVDALNEKFGNLEDAREAGERAADYIVENIIRKTVTGKMRINFDSWVSEKKDLIEAGMVDKAVEILKEKKLTYEQDGALWFRSTEFGDDKDRVLVKADGEKTYFASDCGYILHKIERGFGKMIEIWGADHHGYISRFRAAAKALGLEGELKFIIVQLVRLVKDGKEVRMSKRAGNVVYIDELIEKVGHDVARFFFLMYSPDTHMNFDLGLASECSEKNPVFYVQYAHARICSILRKSEQQPANNNEQKSINLSLLTHEKELSLIRELNKFPELLEEIVETYEVHKLPHYAVKLADKFHSFYNACRVIDEANPELTQARLNLVNAVRIVLAETLNLVGVNAPEKM